ncbi:MAG TPA: GntR family transcriptional regulator [Jiangellaceae bacterium]
MTDAGPGAPKYLRLADDLRRRIRTGEYAVGTRLPTEAVMVEQFRVSPPTVRQALAVLRAEGLVETRHGIGTFVREDRRLQRQSRKRYGRARADEKLLTSHLKHEIVFAGRQEPPAEVAEQLGAGHEQVVVRRRHLHDESGRVVEVGASYIPLDFAGGTYLEKPTVVPKALFLCVEDLAGKKYAQARDHWTSRMPTPVEADVLDLPIGAPILHVMHVARAEDGTVLEISESTWAADSVIIVDDYAIDQEPDGSGDASDV